ncbi:hypothetical protein [Vreelandella sp. TE19]
MKNKNLLLVFMKCSFHANRSAALDTGPPAIFFVKRIAGQALLACTTARRNKSTLGEDGALREKIWLRKRVSEGVAQSSPPSASTQPAFTRLMA